ncbi:MAG: bifunctional tetrahydrofolate synthase/dihydrofolate synthase, partial [Planctomycetes bacterium]|nr:bifunctional tetrahydrofolate synthase/dihydrofolate synthase [Planctomycetota bacterium]
MPRVIPPTDAGIDAWLGEALNLEHTGDYRDLRLDRMRGFMRLLPTPPAPWTVTGTKGKGSTVRLIEAALLAAGESTLAFTSPHVNTVRERWRIDGAPADAASVAAACARVDQLESGSGTRLTYFERCFAIACLLASARPGSAFICEVGLGGRLDCANVLDAAVLVLTNLSRDHCQILGDTLEAIAGEKLALCRPGRPLVVAPQSLPGAE